MTSSFRVSIRILLIEVGYIFFSLNGLGQKSVN